MDVDFGIENQVVSITPAMYDGLTPVTGVTLKIFSDYYRTNQLYSTGLGSSIEFSVPVCPDDCRSKSVPLFYDFEKYDADANVRYVGEETLYSTSCTQTT